MQHDYEAQLISLGFTIYSYEGGIAWFKQSDSGECGHYVLVEDKPIPPLLLTRHLELSHELSGQTCHIIVCDDRTDNVIMGIEVPIDAAPNMANIIAETEHLYAD